MKWNCIYSVHEQGSQNITPSYQLAKVGTKFQPNLAYQEKQKYYFQTIYSKYSIYKLTKKLYIHPNTSAVPYNNRRGTATYA